MIPHNRIKNVDSGLSTTSVAYVPQRALKRRDTRSGTAGSCRLLSSRACNQKYAIATKSEEDSLRKATESRATSPSEYSIL